MEGQRDGVVSPGAFRGNTLYYYPFSLYSIIVRFAIELGRSINPEKTPEVELRLVNLQEGEHLTEDFLTLNAKGQVPALDIGNNVLTESLDILRWLCNVHPELLPDGHSEDIETHLENFYAFHAQPLAVKPETMSTGITNKALELLEKPGLSDAYRRCLEIKSVFHDTTYGQQLNPENVDDVRMRARFFVDAVARLLRQEGRGDAIFIFGDRPTVLDAVATSFLSRLHDMKQTDLVDDDKAWDYHRQMMKTEAWRRTTHGRTTIWQPSDGPAEQWQPL